MAWMRMMGADSVAYHEHTVAGRGDDPVAQRPRLLRLPGRDTACAGAGRAPSAGPGRRGGPRADWRALFGPGGAATPRAGERLVRLHAAGHGAGVSPAQVGGRAGVIGRAEDMHAIVDAERDATLGLPRRGVQEQGGRRGRAQVRTPTAG